MFKPGDTIASHEGWQLLHIDEVKKKMACLFCNRTRARIPKTNVTLREVLLDSKLVFSKRDRLFAGQIDQNGSVRAALSRP